MAGLNLDQLQQSKPVYEKFESKIVYLPTKGQAPLTVTLLGDPINQNTTAKQLEEGLEPGLIFHRWSSFQHPEITKKGGTFTNTKGREVTPKSTPVLHALHSVDENDEPIFLEKPLKDIKTTLLYEVHKDPGYLLFKNPELWPAHYTDDFKAGWNVKTTMALRVFLHDAKTNLPIEEEKILIVDGGFFNETIKVLREGAIENELVNSGGYAFRRITFSRREEAGRSRASVVAKAAGKRLYEEDGFEHLKNYKFALSFSVGDERVFNVDSYDAQREYLMDNYNITIPSSADVEASTTLNK